MESLAGLERRSRTEEQRRSGARSATRPPKYEQVRRFVAFSLEQTAT